MLKVLQATCTNGELVLNEKLSPELEGKTIQIMILDPSESTELIDSKESKVKQFLADPDVNQTIKENFKQELLAIQKRREAGFRGIPAAEVMQRLDLGNG